jgi:hypothetical protein
VVPGCHSLPGWLGARPEPSPGAPFRRGHGRPPSSMRWSRRRHATSTICSADRMTAGQGVAWVELPPNPCSEGVQGAWRSPWPHGGPHPRSGNWASWAPGASPSRILAGHPWHSRIRPRVYRPFEFVVPGTTDAAESALSTSRACGSSRRDGSPHPIALRYEGLNPFKPARNPECRLIDRQGKRPLVSLCGASGGQQHFVSEKRPPGLGMLLEVPRDARPGIGIAGDPGDARPNARLEAVPA